jgi:hypothetical protein
MLAHLACQLLRVHTVNRLGGISCKHRGGNEYDIRLIAPAPRHGLFAGCRPATSGAAMPTRSRRRESVRPRIFI